MPQRRDLVLGELAVGKGFVTRDQVEACFRMQLTSSLPRPLGQILLQEGLLTYDQLEELLFLQAERAPAESRAPSTTTGDGPLLGQMLLARRWVTLDQLEECVREQMKLSREGVGHEPLGQILLRKRYITAQQFDEAIRAQGKTPETPKVETKRAALAPGERFGRYLIVEEIGRGGMGVVFRARDEGLKRDVALKILQEGPGSDARLLERFQREASLAARLRHPGIVAVHEVGIERGVHFFTMDFVDGYTLDLLLANKRMSRDEAVRIIEDVARAIHHAHVQGVLHRDIKPSNIIVDRSGKPLVMDFGLARQVAPEKKLTQEGSALGTPYYMSPEAVRGEIVRIGPATDVYSLGVVLYEMTSGRVPFTGRQAFEIYEQIVSKDPAPPRDRIPDFPVDLQTILLKAIEKSPFHRYETAEALADDLRRIRHHEFIQARPPTLTQKVVRRFRRHGAVIASSVIAVLLVAGIAGWYGFRSGAEYRSEMRRGREALGAGQYAAAQEAFARAAALRPEDAEAADGLQRARAGGYFAEAKRQLADGSIEAAHALFEKARPAPEALEPWLAFCSAMTDARAALERGEWARAFECVGAAPALREGDSIRARLESAARAAVDAEERIQRHRYEEAAEAIRFVPESERRLPSIDALRRHALGIARVTIRTIPPGGDVRGIDAEVTPGVYTVTIDGLRTFPLLFERDATGRVADLDLVVPREPPAGMVYVPPGSFLSGPNRQKADPLPAFWIDRTEVTNREYAKFVSETGYPAPLHWWDGSPPAGREDHPVIYVSCYDAQAYLRWAGKRLPTESEWEKAARGIDGREYPWGVDAAPETAGLRAAGAEARDASPYGAMDLSGNVSEWTSSRGRSGRFTVWGGAYKDGERVRIARFAAVNARVFESPGSSVWDQTGFRGVRPVPPWAGREATPQELHALWQDPKAPAETRRLALAELAGDFSILRSALRAGEEATAREAACRIGLSRHADRVDALVEGLGSESGPIRQACAEALGYRGPLEDRGVDALLRALADDAVAGAAILALLRLDPPDLIARIRAALKDAPRGVLTDTLREFLRQYTVLGSRCLDLGRNDEAARCYARCLSIDPRDPVIYNNRGLAKLRLGDADGCIADCTESLAIDPTVALVHQKLAHAYLVKKDLAKAAEHADRAVQLRNDDFRIARTRGLVRLEQGDLDGARSDLELACRLAPGDEESFFAMGLCEERAGRRPQAAAAYRRALEINPDFDRAFRMLYPSVAERLRAVE